MKFVTEIQQVTLLCRLQNSTKYSIGPRRANFAPNSDPKEATGSCRWVLQPESIHSAAETTIWDCIKIFHFSLIKTLFHWRGPEDVALKGWTSLSILVLWWCCLLLPFISAFLWILNGLIKSIFKYLIFTSYEANLVIFRSNFGIRAWFDRFCSCGC